ncbi:putative leucine-rich repeat-containing protein DDB_G0290503 [Maniola hyperantus]|uniref:putative leucine-rich repeat-containing protein DDB_G0290503 n=1 Tax=Aphantopus hyperantus TaxID=2795564 RepID=UPI00374964DD
MVKCSACGRFLSLVGAASCTLCPGLYHRVCVGLPENGRSPKQWKCPECMAKKPKLGNVNTPVKGTEPSNIESEGSSAEKPESVEKDTILCESQSPGTSQSSDLSLEIRLFREEIRHLRTEIKEFRAELCDVRGAIAHCNQRIDEYDGRLADLEKQFKVSSSRCAAIDKLEDTIAQLKENLIARDHQDLVRNSSANESMQATISQLQNQINDRDQDLLMNDVEISGLQESSSENLISITCLLAKKLGVELDDRDVVTAERSGPRRTLSASDDGEVRARQPRPRPIVVRLARRAVRDNLLRAARVRRGADSSGITTDAEPRRFYVNEHLTRTNRQLFYKAREESRSKNWRFVWTKGGRIYARKTVTGPVHRIRSETDIRKVFLNDSF